MRKKEVLIAAIVTALLSAYGFSQTRTVTNADLEKFRQKRLAAEKQMRENYAELGFPSPEELARREQRSRKEYFEMAERLGLEQDARDEAAFAARAGGQAVSAAPVFPYPNPSFVDYGGYYAPGYFYNGYFYGRRGSYTNRSGYRTRNDAGGLHRFRSFFRTLRRVSAPDNQIRTGNRFPANRRPGTPGRRRN